MLVGVQSQADMAGEDLVLLLAEHGVDLFWGGPLGGAVFFPFPGAALLRRVDTDTHDVEPGAGQDGNQAVLHPDNLKGVPDGFGQTTQYLRQAAAQGLGQQQGRPDHGNVQEQPDQPAAPSVFGFDGVTSC